MNSEYLVEDSSRFFVVFIDEVSLWWLKFLKKGFRHCYLLYSLDEGMSWIEINPMSNRIFFRAYQSSKKIDYILQLKNNQRCSIIEVEAIDVGLKTAPLGLFSCVEFVKRCVGIHSFRTITPYQLYNKLKIVGKKS